MANPATTYQPQLLDPQSATPQPVSPANGRSFKLAELYQLLDCRLVDVVCLTPELILIIDDEGKFRNPAYLNLVATYLWYHHQPERGARIPSWAVPFYATRSNSNRILTA